MRAPEPKAKLVMDCSEVDSLLAEAIRDGAFPGACYAFGDAHEGVSGSVGRQTYFEDAPPVDEDTLWDLASVSKVVGTTTYAMMMLEQRRFELDQPVAEVLPELGRHDKQAITFRNLLLHDSGLVAFRPYYKRYRSPEAILEAIYDERLCYPTGSDSVYSDLNMILLAQALELLSGISMDVFLEKQVFAPLGMQRTGYNPGLGNPNCAPTENVEPWRLELRSARGDRPVTQTPNVDQSLWIQGEVHDPNTFALGGVAGHAGLFSTIGDVSTFLQAMLRSQFVAKPDSVAEFTRRQCEKSTRGLGWDTKSSEGSSAGSRFGPRSFGHTGYTGTSVWADPDSGRFAVLLTNRVHPTSENIKIRDVRPAFHDAVWQVLGA